MNRAVHLSLLTLGLLVLPAPAIADHHFGSRQGHKHHRQYQCPPSPTCWAPSYTLRDEVIVWPGAAPGAYQPVANSPMIPLQPVGRPDRVLSHPPQHPLAPPHGWER